MPGNTTLEGGLVEHFHRGGPWMWPLLLCSVLGVTIILYKAITLGRLRLDAAVFSSQVLRRLRQDGRAAAASDCVGVSPVAAVARATLEVDADDREVLLEAADEETRLQMARLEVHLPMLSTIGAIAPLFGFLGTVTGMIIAFDQIQAASDTTPQLVAGGISQALITTEFGLVIAIPVYTAYNYFISRVRALEHDMDSTARHITNEISSEATKNAA